MMMETVAVHSAIDWSPHHHAYINPYNGCTAGCPYCFWLSQPGWEGRIQVRTNIAQQLEAFLDTWDPGEYLYLGSVCDPFMELDKQWGLTGKCLEQIYQRKIPLLITTSALSDAIFRCEDLLQKMRGQVVIVVELARPEPLRIWKQGGVHRGIEAANRLVRSGLRVYATLAPVLPGITDLQAVLDALDSRIPVYVDSLQCGAGSIQGEKVRNWIRQDYPALQAEYDALLRNPDGAYFREILTRFGENDRVKTFPYQLP